MPDSGVRQYEEVVFVVHRVMGLCVALAVCSCGGAPTPESTRSSEQAAHGNEGASVEAASGMSMGGTVGGLDSRAVRRVVDGATGEVDRCVADGRKRMPYLGGEVAIAVTVNSSGRAAETFLSRSTLGDAAVEACIVKVFASKQWPRPMGGEVGKIDQSFDYAGGYDGLREIGAAELAARMAADAEDGATPFQDLKRELEACRTEVATGPLSVTVYVDEDGLVQGAGLGSADAAGRRAVDCAIMLVKTTSFPASKDIWVKATVEVP